MDRRSFLATLGLMACRPENFSLFGIRDKIRPSQHFNAGLNLRHGRIT